MDGRRNSWTMGSGWHVRSVPGGPPAPKETIDVVSLWAVYDHPKDYQSSYVARLWHEGYPTATTIISPDLETIREALKAKGLTRIERYREDEPLIIEVWI